MRIGETDIWKVFLQEKQFVVLVLSFGRDFNLYVHKGWHSSSAAAATLNTWQWSWWNDEEMTHFRLKVLACCIRCLVTGQLNPFESGVTAAAAVMQEFLATSGVQVLFPCFLFIPVNWFRYRWNR